MKIPNRFPNITNQTPETETPLKPDKFEANKYKGPDSVHKTLPPKIPEDVFDIVTNRNDLATEISNMFGGNLDRPSPKPEIESQMQKYQGPNSAKPPEIESPVDKYKGPKSVVKEPVIESRTEKYKGPDSVSKGLPPTIPDEVLNIADNRIELANKIKKR